jgi:hypothetical protein
MTIDTHKMMLGGLLALTLGCLGAFATTASADFGLASAGTALVTDNGGPGRQAGSHPDFETFLAFNRYTNTIRNEVEPDDAVRDIRVDLPAGMVANPQAVGTCTPNQLSPPANPSTPGCPLNSQVGKITAALRPDTPLDHLAQLSGLFNMVPAPGEPASRRGWASTSSESR